MKRAAIYCRVSTADQKIDTQLYQLRELAATRGYEIVKEYCDKGISGSKARRPALDELMRDARRRKFHVVLVAAFDRVARSTKHFLQVLDELDDLNVQFVSARENVDTTGALGRMFVTMIGSIAELERSLIAERIRQGLHRAKLQGVRLGRRPLHVDRTAVVDDRLSGLSLTACARKYGVSRASVIRLVRAAQKQEMEALEHCLPMAAEESTVFDCTA